MPKWLGFKYRGSKRDPRTQRELSKSKWLTFEDQDFERNEKEAYYSYIGVLSIDMYIPQFFRDNRYPTQVTPLPIMIN